ncbi:hypothetical protein ACO2Q3_15620 [Caulobacter sp. KR2-114]|uniref:hypothetical protein n=1 Tax=Caulobacter sp. KR2-114 TaxID=3400912 RepID=UPI003C0E4E1A
MSALGVRGRGAAGVGLTVERDAPVVQRLFNPITAIWLVLVGVFAFSALVVLGTYERDLRGGDDGGAHALSRSAVGYAGMAQFLRDAGQTVVISRNKLSKGHAEGLLIATPPLDGKLADVKALNFGGPVLLVLPKWNAFPDFLRRGWVGEGRPIDLTRLDKASLLGGYAPARRPGASPATLFARGDVFGDSLSFRTGPIDRLQVLQTKDLIPVLQDETGATVLGRDPKSNVYVLSDPDLLDNHGLKSVDNALAGARIVETLKAGDGPVLFDVSLDGFARERNVMRLLFDPPFLAVTLCLFLAACLAGFQAACRFGATRRAGRVFALGKEALADNTAALIRLTGREHRMGLRYAELTRNLAARATGVPRELTGDALTRFLDRMGAQRGAEDRLSELTAIIGGAANREQVLAAARRLFRWRLEMTRERQ